MSREVDFSLKEIFDYAKEVDALLTRINTATAGQLRRIVGELMELVGSSSGSGRHVSAGRTPVKAEIG